MAKHHPSKHELDNRANQLNSTHPAYYLSRGFSPEEAQHLAVEAGASSGSSIAQSPGSGGGSERSVKPPSK